MLESKSRKPLLRLDSNMMESLLSPEMGGFTLKEIEPNLLVFQRGKNSKNKYGARNYESACSSGRQDAEVSWLNSERSFYDSSNSQNSSFNQDNSISGKSKAGACEPSTFKRASKASKSNPMSPKSRSIRFSLKCNRPKRMVKFVSAESLPQRRSPTRYGNYLVRLFDGNLYETKEDQARSVLNSYKQEIKKNSQDVAKKYKKAPIRSIISSINPRRNTNTSGLNEAQFRFKKHTCQTPSSSVSSSEFSESEADVVSTSSESKKMPKPWTRGVGRSTFASKRAYEFRNPQNRFRQTIVRNFEDLDFLEFSESGGGEELTEQSEHPKYKQFQEIQDSFFDSDAASEKLTPDNVVKPDFVLPSSFKALRRLQRSRSVISQNMFDVEELTESQIESKEELAKAALIKIIDRSYFGSAIMTNEDEEDKQALKRIQQRQEAQRRELRAQITTQLERIAPYKEDQTPEESACMTHKLIELGKMYKLEMGRILVNMMADRGSICLHSLKRKILNGVDLNNKEVVAQIKRKSRRKSMAMGRPSFRIGQISQLSGLKSKRTVRLYRSQQEKKKN